MRVISGFAKGHRLLAPTGKNTRPTLDKVKESLFNIIADTLFDCRFLDLYSGSGAIGIEALSRGAAYAAFVEQDRAAKAIIVKNLEATKLIEKAEIFGLPVEKALAKLSRQTDPFHIIFLDPPYAMTAVPDLLDRIAAFGLLSPGGTIIAEHSRRDPLVLPTGSAYTITDTRCYGSETAISFIG